MTDTRGIRVLFHSPYAEGKGLLASDARVRTLRKVLISYPEVRHILPDRISLDAGADPRTLDTVARFLERQHWLVKSVVIE
ncbi:MAG: hypothetical protein WED01_01485 [Candidatus Rokuibacteriota bacterium]